VDELLRVSARQDDARLLLAVRRVVEGVSETRFGAATTADVNARVVALMGDAFSVRPPAATPPAVAQPLATAPPATAPPEISAPATATAPEASLGTTAAAPAAAGIGFGIAGLFATPNFDAGGGVWGAALAGLMKDNVVAGLGISSVYEGSLLVGFAGGIASDDNAGAGPAPAVPRPAGHQRGVPELRPRPPLRSVLSAPSPPRAHCSAAPRWTDPEVGRLRDCLSSLEGGGTEPSRTGVARDVVALQSSETGVNDRSRRALGVPIEERRRGLSQVSRGGATPSRAARSAGASSIGRARLRRVPTLR
jgi:hypothetical protein